MEKQLKKGAWSEAHHIYKDGAYSKNYAELKLLKPLDKDIPIDTKVHGASHSGGNTKGRTIAAAAAGDTTLQVQYHISSIQDEYVECQVGALWRTHHANLDGCESIVKTKVMATVFCSFILTQLVRFFDIVSSLRL